MLRRKRMWGRQPASAKYWVLPCRQWSGSLAEVGESNAGAPNPPSSCARRYCSLHCQHYQCKPQPLLSKVNWKLRWTKPFTNIKSCEWPALGPSPSHTCFSQGLDKVRHSVWVAIVARCWEKREEWRSKSPVPGVWFTARRCWSRSKSEFQC